MRLLSEKYKTEERLVVPTTCPKDKTVFIVYDKECVRDKHQTDFGQEVLFRNPKTVNTEAMQVKNFCQENGNYITKEERRMLKKCITENCDTLLENHRNINVISMSPVKSKENGKHIRPCLCVVIYCSSKGFIPFGEKIFPKTLKSGLTCFDTDIREGFFEFGPGTYSTSKSSNYHQQLRMGCQYAVEGKPMCATIGPFVKLNGHMAFLTCAHAIYGIDSNGYNIVSSSTFVEQPPSTTFAFPSGNQFNFRCGEVKKAVFAPHAQPSVDAAVVLISEPTRLPHRGEFAMDNEIRLNYAGFDDLPYFNSGNIHLDPSTIDGDKRIVKFGAETHVTKGNLKSVGTVISAVSADMGVFGQPGASVTMRNQMEISGVAGYGTYFQPGDSGAGVFYVDKTPAGQELTCIGIAIGTTSYGNAIVTPIKAVLDALQLPSLCQFP
ncbi:uncharacterized protein LOC110459753 [Mizuhopecten yessoensis]|uniref:uncharacterized protein LOC110459753 n=1 Tax=Mizuhopecten yessoensis TaxID=6573 RepID=UPI000B45DBE1|nr:uncharacterized protein LOC110459753 [Mizuhopecten yessoensis]